MERFSTPTSTDRTSDLVLVSPDAEHTASLGSALAPLLLSGDVVCLWGDFGAGKTTFVKGVGLGLSIEQPIVSPSFGLLNVYNTPEEFPDLYHLDLYRISNLDEAEAFGVEDFLDADAVTFVEWPSVIVDVLPPDRLDVYFEWISETSRRLKFRAHGARPAELLDTLQAYRRK